MKKVQEFGAVLSNNIKSAIVGFQVLPDFV